MRGQLSEGRRTIKQLPAMQPPDRLIDDLEGGRGAEPGSALVERLATLGGRPPRRIATLLGVGLLVLLTVAVVLLNFATG